MSTQSEMKLFGKPDWKWVGVSYCLFVVWHLLPTILAVGLYRGSGIDGFGIGSAVWMFFGLTFIGAYVGYRSVGVTILEPAIAGVLYVVTLFFSVLQVWSLPIRMYRLPVAAAMLLASFAIVLVSAWVGEIIQAKKEAV